LNLAEERWRVTLRRCDVRINMLMRISNRHLDAEVDGDGGVAAGAELKRVDERADALRNLKRICYLQRAPPVG
jgi:hypothetical protein